MDDQINSSANAQMKVQQNSDQLLNQMQGLANEFMNLPETQKRIRGIVGRGQRFSINIDEVREFNRGLSAYIAKNPIEAIKMFEDQLNQTVKGLQEDGGKQNQEKLAVQSSDIHFPKKVQTYYINFEGNFGKNYVTPRGLKAQLVNQFVQVQGIVTKMSMVRPKIQTSVHYCEDTKKGLIKHYDDNMNLGDLAEGDGNKGNMTNAFPTKDQNDNPLSAEYGYCVYKDSQTITIQEMPENAPVGQLPRSVQVVLENDLVDKVKPGDRVQVSGVFRVIHRGLEGSFGSVLVATGVESLLAEKQKPRLSEQDIKNIRKLAKDKDIFGVLGESIAPSIEGALNVKKSILLQLLGGAEKVLLNGTHLRGDINLLMVGDPSTAKSQLLRHVIDIAPLALNTTGRGSSGVGLTAAVTMDKDTGERFLEAGAMVLADRGVVCIDEFDKMNDGDRVAIHEVMEQQTVTIAKAGIHTTLNARCSVIAAANPIYSEYARDQSVGRNIGLPDSLLSRFDLLFVMLDEKDPENDRRIAERVITNHRYQNPNHDAMAHFNFANDDYVVEPEVKDNQGGDGRGTTIYEKHINKTTNNITRNVVTREFLKKYISFAKSQKHPELDGECTEYAAQLYSVIRQKAAYSDQSKISCPVTVRTLETMIRLATAHSKLRLGKVITTSDIDIAVNLIHLSIFGQVMDEADEEPVKRQAAAPAAPRQDQHMAGSSKVIVKQSKGRMEGVEDKKRVKFQGRNDDEDDDDEFLGDESAQPVGQRKTTRRQLHQLDEQEASSKRMKIDEEQELRDLLQNTRTFDTASQSRLMLTKQFVYKLAAQVQNATGSSRVQISTLWKNYFKMSPTDQLNSETGVGFLSDRNALIDVLQHMESEDLIAIDGDDVVMI